MAEPQEKEPLQIRDDGHSLLEALIGDTRAGRIDYFVLPGEHGAPPARVGVHTVVSPAFEGQGVGGTLAAEFYRAAAEEGRTVVPLCPYLKHWSEKHPNAAPAVDPDTLRRAAAHVEQHPDLW